MENTISFCWRLVFYSSSRWLLGNYILCYGHLLCLRYYISTSRYSKLTSSIIFPFVKILLRTGSFIPECSISVLAVDTLISKSFITFSSLCTLRRRSSSLLASGPHQKWSGPILDVLKNYKNLSSNSFTVTTRDFSLKTKLLLFGESVKTSSITY